MRTVAFRCDKAFYSLLVAHAKKNHDPSVSRMIRRLLADEMSTVRKPVKSPVFRARTTVV